VLHPTKVQTLNRHGPPHVLIPRFVSRSYVLLGYHTIAVVQGCLSALTPPSPNLAQRYAEHEAEIHLRLYLAPLAN
jgi:hypothetical protein